MAEATHHVHAVGGTVCDISTDSVLFAGVTTTREGWTCALTDGRRLQSECSLQVRNDPEVITAYLGDEVHR